MEHKAMRLLIVGDFVAHSGFARVNEALAGELSRAGWDVSVLTINYHGDPHPLQKRYRLYPAALGGDMHGFARLPAVVRAERPDAILIVNDPQVVNQYLAVLETVPDAPPVVAYMPVDGTGMNPAQVRRLPRLAGWAAYTRFGWDELLRAAPGLDMVPGVVIPHGIDLDTFRPIPRDEARRMIGRPVGDFVVLVVDRNQPRKRLDLAFAGFARFAASHPDAVLHYHGALADVGWDVEYLAEQHGIADRLVVTSRNIQPAYGLPAEQLAAIYSAADVKLSTAAGEGWGLTTMEAMSCGVACIVPDFAAYGEWCKGAALLMPVDASAPWVGFGSGVNAVYHCVRPEVVADALARLYYSRSDRDALAAAGRALVEQPEFRWSRVAREFDALLRTAVEAGRVAA